MAPAQTSLPRDASRALLEYGDGWEPSSVGVDIGGAECRMGTSCGADILSARSPASVTCPTSILAHNSLETVLSCEQLRFATLFDDVSMDAGI